MTGMRTRILAAATALLIALIGCAGFLGEPTSAEALLVRYAANHDNENFSVSSEVNFAIRVSGLRATIPVEADLEVADKAAHGTITADMSSLEDADGEHTYELYGELQGTSIIWYVRDTTTDDVPWDRSEIDLDFELDIPTVVELLSDAKFMRVAYETDPEIYYELVLPASDLLRAILAKGEVTTTFGEVNEDALLDILSESKVHVFFYKDCLIRSVRLDLDFGYEDKSLLPIPSRLSVGVAATFDGYGNVDASSTAVPGEVKDSSKLTDDPLKARDTATLLQEAL